MKVRVRIMVRRETFSCKAIYIWKAQYRIKELTSAPKPHPYLVLAGDEESLLVSCQFTDSGAD